MKAQLLALARQIARAIRAALDSKAAVRDELAETLRELLPAPRLWALAVVLASWELSKPERNRAELAQLLAGSGVPSFWPQLDLFATQLDPFVQASHFAQRPEEVTEAALRFFAVVERLGPSLVRQVVKSRDFRKAAEVISRNLPDPDGQTAPAKTTPAKTTPQPSPQPSPDPGDWRPGGVLAEREQIATDYLIFLGWDRPSVERFLAGKR